MRLTLLWYFAAALLTPSVLARVAPSDPPR